MKSRNKVVMIDFNTSWTNEEFEIMENWTIITKIKIT